MRRVDLTGKRFGRWIALERTGKDHKGQSLWACKCDCGNKSTLTLGSLRSGNSTSCGCFRNENSSRKTHGKSQSNTYNLWKSMKSRCYNKNCKAYKNYGERGISVCDEWKMSFDKFLEDMGEKPKSLSLDRIDNNGDYELKNCRWSSYNKQANNKRSNRFLSFNGETKTLSEWSRSTKIGIATLWKRLDMGWNEEETLRTPIKINIVKKV